MDSNTSFGTDLIDPAFAGMSLAEVCALASRLQTQVRHTKALNAKLTHEMAVLKRLKFAATSERFSAEQKSLLEEAIDEDLEALAREAEKLQTTAKKPADKNIPKRQPCHQTCRGEMFTTSQKTPPAAPLAAAASSSASAKTSRRSSITCPAASRSSGMCEASGPASNARRSSRRRCRRPSSTRGSPLPA